MLIFHLYSIRQKYQGRGSFLPRPRPPIVIRDPRYRDRDSAAQSVSDCGSSSFNPREEPGMHYRSKVEDWLDSLYDPDNYTKKPANGEGMNYYMPTLYPGTTSDTLSEYSGPQAEEEKRCRKHTKRVLRRYRAEPQQCRRHDSSDIPSCSLKSPSKPPKQPKPKPIPKPSPSPLQYRFQPPESEPSTVKGPFSGFMFATVCPESKTSPNVEPPTQAAQDPRASRAARMDNNPWHPRHSRQHRTSTSKRSPPYGYHADTSHVRVATQHDAGQRNHYRSTDKGKGKGKGKSNNYQYQQHQRHQSYIDNDAMSKWVQNLAPDRR